MLIIKTKINVPLQRLMFYFYFHCYTRCSTLCQFLLSLKFLMITSHTSMSSSPEFTWYHQKYNIAITIWQRYAWVSLCMTSWFMTIYDLFLERLFHDVMTSVFMTSRNNLSWNKWHKTIYGAFIFIINFNLEKIHGFIENNSFLLLITWFVQSSYITIITLCIQYSTEYFTLHYTNINF